MYLLLTIVSVLCAWALLTVLVISLLMVLKPLEGTRKYMERIAFGVRAIEQQLSSLGPRLDAVAGTLGTTAGTLNVAAVNLRGVDDHFAAAGAMVRRWFGR